MVKTWISKNIHFRRPYANKKKMRVLASLSHLVWVLFTTCKCDAAILSFDIQRASTKTHRECGRWRFNSSQR